MNSLVVGNPALCIGCKACMIACAKNHLQDGGAHLYPVVYGDPTFETREFNPRLQLAPSTVVTVPLQCRHCEDAACIRVCPEGAIRKNGTYVEIVEGLCVGCKTCVMACPFGAINVQTTVEEVEGTLIAISQVSKCDLCGGSSPACVAICPAGALSFIDGKEEEIERRARRRKGAGLQ